jgi:hypothetical protein
MVVVKSEGTIFSCQCQFFNEKENFIFWLSKKRKLWFIFFVIFEVLKSFHFFWFVVAIFNPSRSFLSQSRLISHSNIGIFFHFFSSTKWPNIVYFVSKRQLNFMLQIKYLLLQKVYRYEGKTFVYKMIAKQTFWTALIQVFQKRIFLAGFKYFGFYSLYFELWNVIN